MITKDLIATVIAAQLAALERLATKTPWSVDDLIMGWLRRKEPWLNKIVWAMLSRASDDPSKEELQTLAMSVIAEKGTPTA